jgi:aspartyl-tRNA(Asn)/glutamyl-tRNA(Gln) amidotransferase subunit B
MQHSSTRVKEAADDYRYFPDPDLPPLFLSNAFITEIESQMPELPEQIKRKLMDQYALSEYDASLISEDKDFTHYFLQTANHTKEYKSAIANWLLVTIKSFLNENHSEIKDFIINPVKVAELINLVSEGSSQSTARHRKKYFRLL